MNDSLHADMCDLTLAERLGNKTVTRYEVTGITDYDQVRRIQAFCDAQNRTVRWQHRRNYGQAVIHVEPAARTAHQDHRCPACGTYRPDECVVCDDYRRETTDTRSGES